MQGFEQVALDEGFELLDLGIELNAFIDDALPVGLNAHEDLQMGQANIRTGNEYGRQAYTATATPMPTRALDVNVIADSSYLAT